MGFPSPTQDHIELRIDLNKILMPHSAYTLMIETPAGFTINDRVIQGQIGDKVAFQFRDYSQLGRLFRTGIITQDG